MMANIDFNLKFQCNNPYYKKIMLEIKLLGVELCKGSTEDCSAIDSAILMTGLVITILIDTFVVKVNDLIDKYFIPLQGKLVLFSINSAICLLLQYSIIMHIKNSFEAERRSKTSKIKSFYFVSITSLVIVATSIGLLIFQQIYYRYYESWTVTLIIVVSYGTAAVLIAWLAKLFLSWYRSNRNLIVFLYFVSMLGIAFNLVMAATYVSMKVNAKPTQVFEFTGSSGDPSGGRFVIIESVYNISSFIAFFSIWLTTAILMNYYREKLVNVILNWILLTIPIVYFAVTFFYQYTLSTMLTPYMQVDPVTISIFLGALLSLSKPIGGLLFGAAFWNLSKTVKYDRKIRAYMIISGCGIFLIFATNQAVTQIVSPYPPFGLARVTVLNLAAYLMLIGIYNSAIHVSANDNLRKNIRKHAVQSKLLELIGHAEMEREIQKMVSDTIRDQELIDVDKETAFELDENELKRYLDVVIKEVKKGERTPD